MSILPTDDAITRFKANEERIDIFVNDPLSTGYYTTNETVPRQVKTLPELADGIVESASLRADLVSNTAGKGAALVAFIGPDGNPYTVADLASDATGKGDALLRTKQPYTGAVSRTQHDKNQEWVSVKDFGAVGDGIANDTLAIQTAINYASNSHIKTIYLPAGIYKYTRLYCYYDASLNPGFNTNRSASVRLLGDGIPSVFHSLTGGTTLKCTESTGSGIVVSPASLDGGAYPSRNFVAENINFEGALDYIMEARGVSFFRLLNCQFTNTGTASGCLHITSNWVSVIEKTNFEKYPYASATTASAIDFSTTIPGGLLNLRDVTASGHAYGLRMYSGGWQSINIVDSELMGSEFAIFINGNCQLLSIRGCYFEGSCKGFIRDSGGSNSITNLSVKDSWFLGSEITEKSISLNGANNISIEDCVIQDQQHSGKPFLHIASLSDDKTFRNYICKNLSFTNYVSTVATTLFTGEIPAMIGINYYRGDGVTTLHSTSKHPWKLQVDAYSNSQMVVGNIAESRILDYGGITGGYVGVLNTDMGVGYPAFVSYYCASGNPTLRLPSVSYMNSNYYPVGSSITITNHMSSGSYGIITNNEANPSTLCNLQPGTQRKFVFKGDTWL